MSEKTPMTSRSYRVLQEELQRLKAVERLKVAKALAEARAHGDLSENAEYDAAKQAQGLLEAKIRQIESRIATAQVIEISRLSGDKVVFGATVQLSDMDTDEERTVMIVGEDEADVNKGLISYVSPLARAMIGKLKGDTVVVRLPAGQKEYEIQDVRFEEQPA